MHTRKILAIPFVVLGLLALVAEAAPLKKVRPAPAPTLTLGEQHCASYGKLVAAIVVDRNALVPLTTTLSRLRTILAKANAVDRESMVTAAHLLYSFPEISEQEARHVFEIGCLSPKTVQPETTATPLLWR